MVEPRFLKPLFLAISLSFLAIFIAMPIFTILREAFSEGVGEYLRAISDENAISAIKLSLLTALVVVPINTFFGLVLAYLLAKFEFRGKTFISTLLDLPFAISPVVAGLMIVLLFANNGFFGASLENLGINIIFALPAIFIASAFVTFPFVAKETLNLMQELGNEEEEAALSLGASGFKSFWLITLPNIKSALFYGVILTNARVFGEFGAVAVVSAKIIGLTMTMPLHIEMLYNDYLYTSAFAVASLLLLLTVVTLVFKFILKGDRLGD